MLLPSKAGWSVCPPVTYLPYVIVEAAQPVTPRSHQTLTARADPGAGGVDLLQGGSGGGDDDDDDDDDVAARLPGGAGEEVQKKEVDRVECIEGGEAL